MAMGVPLAYRIADAYERLEHDPDNHEARDAFAAFSYETRDRFEDMRRTIAVYPWLAAGQPYKGFHDLAARVAATRELHVFLTRSGYGHTALPDHPLLEASGIAIDGEPFTFNDLSRAVHDHDGHLASGGNFSLAGEMRAARAQMQHYSVAARRVLFVEIVGQICCYFFGSYLRMADGLVACRGEPGYVPFEGRRYPDQKCALLPASLLDEWKAS